MPVTVHHFSTEQQSRDIAERNDRFMKINGREFTFDDWLKTIGGCYLGQSQIESRRTPGCGEDSGVRNQT